MSELTTKPDHADSIGEIRDQQVFAGIQMQAFLDDLQLKLNNRLFGQAVIFDPYLVATVPPATEYEGGQIYVTDETGGKTFAWSDGTNWLRLRDNVIIS